MSRFNLPFAGNKSTYFSFLFLCFTSLSYFGDAMAVTCLSGCGDLNFHINRNLSSSENEVGRTYGSENITLSEKRIQHNAGTEMEWVSYIGGAVAPPYTNPGQYVYQKIDDYISIGLRRGEHYAPYNAKVVNATGPNIGGDRVFEQGEVTTNLPSDMQVQLRIDKKIVSGAYSKNILLAEIGRCQPYGCASKQVILQRIYVDVNISASQSCELNAGDVINIDFGNLSSGAFNTAGVIAQGVQPKSKTVSVKCDNIAGNAQLTMRLQADKTNGNIVVSDENNDVGFRVTNNNGTPLVPNNLSSVIPFVLDSNARQNVTIQAYPVSVTGNKPTEGPVTSRAYLRVDFP
ncbi:fimbrial protein [Serratia fonticola]|uniref:fimbrial protein n=1 Tax=Serratia fonticola TaxID=47917 RepID=UPI001FD7C33C|nr:fimbrial protein [Serratia fonticola]